MALRAEPGLELWVEEPKTLKVLEEPVAVAWKEALAILPEPAPDTVPPIRIVVLAEEDSIRAYARLFAPECARLGIAPPPERFYDDAARLGSGRWSYPPLCLIRSARTSSQLVLTRAVHDLGALRISLAASEQAYGVPEFLVEGFAGMLVRRAVKKPTALVSHQGAALKETLHGYGVFAGIGEAMNDASNHPGNWPTVMRTAARAWDRKKVIDPDERIDALLLRTPEEFSRADYAYSWAVTEFLLDDRYPVGEEAAAAAADRKWKPGEPPERNRRAMLLAVFRTMRHPNYRLADAGVRARLILDFLARDCGEDADSLHAAFRHWLATGLPKR